MARNGEPATQDIRWTKGGLVLQEQGDSSDLAGVDNTHLQIISQGEGRVSLCSRSRRIRSLKSSSTRTPVP